MKNRKLRVLLTAVMILTVMSVPARQSKGPEWLKNALFYQIYPSSFMDSDGMEIDACDKRGRSSSASGQIVLIINSIVILIEVVSGLQVLESRRHVLLQGHPSAS